MPTVTIIRVKKNPPNDDIIEKAMRGAGGEVTSIAFIRVDGQNSRLVTYKGDPNHRIFKDLLKCLAGDFTGEPWEIRWGTALGLQDEAVAGTVGTQYGITIHNASQIPDHKAIVFQKDPTVPADVVTLAWLSKTTQPGTQVAYSWTLDYNFVWGQTGQLKPGVNYEAGQVIPADLTDHNQVTLSYPDGGFVFGPTSVGPATGSLFIAEAGDVPGYGSSEQGSVGIGMYGQGTFVQPTNPTSGGGLQFSPHPQYWVAFGNYAQGEVVDESVLYAPTQVMFSGSSFHADCVFNGSSWTITYS